MYINYIYRHRKLCLNLIEIILKKYWYFISELTFNMIKMCFLITPPPHDNITVHV